MQIIAAGCTAESSLGDCVAVASEQIKADFFPPFWKAGLSQKQRLVESPFAQPLNMQRNRQNKVGFVEINKGRCFLCQGSKGSQTGEVAAEFESEHQSSYRLLIEEAGAGLGKGKGIVQAGEAEMIFVAR